MPPEASKSDLNGLPSASVMAACVRMRCCTPVPSSDIRSAVSTTVAPLDSERRLLLMSARIGRLVSGERYFEREIERYVCLPPCRCAGCATAAGKVGFKGSDAAVQIAERCPRTFKDPASPKPKRDKSGAVMLRLSLAAFFAEAAVCFNNVPPQPQIDGGTRKRGGLVNNVGTAGNRYAVERAG